MIERIEKFRAYLDYIERHYINVQLAWDLINKKCPDSFRFKRDQFIWDAINENIKNHDLSKLSSEEFLQYRQFFFPTTTEKKDEKQFKLAWEHHKLENPHHWQNWTKKYTYDPAGYIYFIENICDWIAMGFEFDDTALSYYNKNSKDIHLPEWAVQEMFEIFKYIYPTVYQ